MKVFVIQTKFGYYTQAERILHFNFPPSLNGSLINCTHYPFKSAARSVIKKHNLWAQVEEFESENL